MESNKLKPESKITQPKEHLRNSLADVVGFAHLKSQMDAVMSRISEKQGELLKQKSVLTKSCRTVISPHDDYTYVGYLYPLALQNVKAKTVILFGVFHKALALKMEDKLVFDSFTHWLGPYEKIKVSPLRDEIIARLPKDHYEVNDIFQKLEWSVEAQLPFLQYADREVEFISILVSPMAFTKMKEVAKSFAEVLGGIMQEKNLEWGKDVAIVISNDATHYGDEDWGVTKFDRYGVDEKGKKLAVEHDHEIIKNCLEGEITEKKVEQFMKYVVEEENHRVYKWAWCGRFSVPFGLLASFYLEGALNVKKSEGVLLGYGTSIDQEPLPVEDLDGMGTTAPANLRHWVGYASVGFR